MSEFGFTWVCNELYKELNKPLPGGRGFQRARDQRIKQLATTLSTLELPDR